MEAKEDPSKLEQGNEETVVRRNGKCENGKSCIRRDLSYMDTLEVLNGTFFEKRNNVFCRIDGKIANGEIGG